MVVAPGGYWTNAQRKQRVIRLIPGFACIIKGSDGTNVFVKKIHDWDWNVPKSPIIQWIRHLREKTSRGSESLQTCDTAN